MFYKGSGDKGKKGGKDDGKNKKGGGGGPASPRQTSNEKVFPFLKKRSGKGKLQGGSHKSDSTSASAAAASGAEGGSSSHSSKPVSRARARSQKQRKREEKEQARRAADPRSLRIKVGCRFVFALPNDQGRVNANAVVVAWKRETRGRYICAQVLCECVSSECWVLLRASEAASSWNR